MISLDSSLVATLAALAGMILAIAVLVQIVQEVYKYLTSSKGRAYEIALTDFLGPWGRQLLKPGVIPEMRVRGPFQFKRIRPEGVLLPLKREELAEGLERLAPQMVRRATTAMQAEIAAQATWRVLSPGTTPGLSAGMPSVITAGASPGATQGASPTTSPTTSPSVSPAWTSFLAELANVTRGASGYWVASDIRDFLVAWNHVPVPSAVSSRAASPLVSPIDPAPAESEALARELDDSATASLALMPPPTMDVTAMHAAFRARFLPHVDQAVQRYPQLNANFEYSYARRNTRQTFFIAFLVILLFDYPIDRLYDAARHRDDAGTLALTQQMLGVYERMTDSASRDPQIREYWSTLLKTQDTLLRSRIVEEGEDVVIPRLTILDRFVGDDEAAPRKQTGSIWGFLLGCIVTTLLVSFGAPVWNDIASSLLRLQKGWKTPPTSGSEPSHD